MMDTSKDKGILPIPNRLSEVTADWIADLLYKVVGVPIPDNLDGTHNGITLLQIRANPCDGFHESCKVTVRCSSQPDEAYHFVVEIVPCDEDLRDVIIRHNLFTKELVVHEKLLPLFKKYVQNRSNGDRTVDVNFSVPKYLYGDYDEATGTGVMVFEDFIEHGFKCIDKSLMILEAKHVREIVQNLATFHAISVAYQTTEKTKLEELFPVLDGETGNTWFQADMTAYLQEMYVTCSKFFKSIPGQEKLSKLFELKMSNPEEFHKTSQCHPTKMRCVIHGDLWHNNLYFKGSKSLIMADWQMCHIGMATNDLCFLLFSSTTPHFRRDHWDSTIALYYNCFCATIKNLNVTEEQFSLSYDEYLMDIKASIPLSLFFCGNIQDLEVNNEAALARAVSIEDTKDNGVEEAFQSLHSCFDFMLDDPELGGQPEFPDLKRVYKNDDEAKGGIQMTIAEEEDHEGAMAIPASNSRPRDGPPQMIALSPKTLSKVPTIASDKDLESLVTMRRSRKGVKIDPREARALRRRLYLDLYKEAASKGLI